MSSEHKVVFDYPKTNIRAELLEIHKARRDVIRANKDKGYENIFELNLVLFHEGGQQLSTDKLYNMEPSSISDALALHSDVVEWLSMDNLPQEFKNGYSYMDEFANFQKEQKMKAELLREYKLLNEKMAERKVSRDAYVKRCKQFILNAFNNLSDTVYKYEIKQQNEDVYREMVIEANLAVKDLILLSADDIILHAHRINAYATSSRIACAHVKKYSLDQFARIMKNFPKYTLDSADNILKDSADNILKDFS